jgi:acetyl esterase/lipase
MLRVGVYRLGLIIAVVLGAAGGACSDDPVASKPRPSAPAPAPVPVPTPPRTVGDLVYARPGGKPLHLDLHLPSSSGQPLPLVVWIHGGGWRSNNRGSFPVARALVEHGFAVASIDYRLSQHAAFPAQLHDSKAAVRWLRANADRWSLDPQRFGAWGNSSGGHLAALLGTTGDETDLDRPTANANHSSRVRAVCVYYGPTDLERLAPGREEAANQELVSMVDDLLGGPIAERLELARRASPINHVSADDAAFLFVHGARDRMVLPAHSRLMHAALVRAGVPAELHFEPDARHSIKFFDDPPMIERVARFFERHLGK